MTTLTAIIPTVATDLTRLAMLRRAILSALMQTREGDEIIVAADTTDNPLDAARELCGRLGQEAPEGACVRFVPHSPGQHDYGHSQINHAMSVARGDYLTFQDDDDCYLSGAFDAMRAAAAGLPSPRPLLFRFRTHYGAVVWMQPGVVRQGMIGGHCAVFPNLPSRLGKWGPHYEGDFSFICSTLDLWGGDTAAVWCERLISIARPAWRD